jgi:hypothetical protein
VRGPEAHEDWDWDREWRLVGADWQPLPRPAPRVRR